MLSWSIIPLSLTNCYLLELEKGFLLVDCGRARDKDRLEKALNKLGLSSADLSCLFLTHHHSDHCGLLPMLTAKNPGLTVIMSEKCSQFLMPGRHFIPARKITPARP
jgi:glyoxylase-like metal-dependent hydrolase (beta-lactamase superfamily II)